MTASRLEGADGLEVVRCSSVERLEEAFSANPGAVLVVDLTAVPELPEAYAQDDFLTGAIIAFAPHVREDLLDAARPHSDLVVPRGAVVKRLDTVVRRGIEARGGNAAPGETR
jgi:hypothetical protein